MDTTAKFNLKQQSPPIQHRNLATLDLLRGLAAIGVVFFHAQKTWLRSENVEFSPSAAEIALLGHSSIAVQMLNHVWAYGFLGVSLFFVISGFCIHLRQVLQPGRLDLKSFAIARFARLYPLYVVMVFVGMITMGTKVGFGAEPVTVANFLGHLVLWPYFVSFGQSILGIIPAMWSLTVEVHFYLLYMLLFPLFRRIGISRCAICGLVIGIAYRAAWRFLHLDTANLPRIMEPHLFAPARFGEWLLGAWAAELYVSGQLTRGIWRGKNGLRIAVAAIVGIVGILLISRRFGWTRNGFEVPVAIGILVLICGLVGAESQGSKIAGGWFGQIARWLGDRSYSLYLVHFTVIGCTVEAYCRLAGVRNKDTLAATSTMMGLMVLAMAITLFVTEVTYRLIEKPSHKLGRRLRKRMETADTACPSIHAANYRESPHTL